MSTTKSDFFDWKATLNDFSAPEKACGWAVHPFGGILPCTARDTSSRRSHFLKSQAPSRRDRSLRQALPAPRTPRWAFHRARSAVPEPTCLNLADERWTDIFITEPAAHSQAFKDSRQVAGVAHFEFRFIPDFIVPALQ